MLADRGLSFSWGTTRLMLVDGGQTKLAHEHGGVTKAANALISPALVPRDAVTLELLRSEHPLEDQAAIAACTTTIFGGAQGSPATFQGTIGGGRRALLSEGRTSGNQEGELAERVGPVRFAL